MNDRCDVTFGGVPPEKLTGQGKKFVDEYQKKHGKIPEAYAVYGYESARVAIAAIEKAGKKDLGAIVEAAMALKDFEGMLGKWSFDENGDISIKLISGNTIKDGKFEFVQLLGDAPPVAEKDLSSPPLVLLSSPPRAYASIRNHPMPPAAADTTLLESFLQHCIIGLTNGSLFALIAIGYTMVDEHYSG